MLLLRPEDEIDYDRVRKGRKRKVDIYVRLHILREKNRGKREREWERWKEREIKIDRLRVREKAKKLN